MDELPTIDEGAVVVGVDDSDDARRALRFALAEAEAHDVPLYAVSVWQYPLKGVPLQTADEDPVDGQELTLQRLRAFVADVFGGEVPERVRCEAVFGYPGKILCALGERARMIVVGPRGVSRLAALTLGSTADHAVKHAPCPVVVVRG